MSLLKSAKENNIDITKMSITTDWNYDTDNLNEEIKDKVKEDLSVDIEITFDYQKKIDEEEILANEEDKSYTVTFDSTGGSNVDSQTVIDGESALAPENPTRDGYTFVEWQLNNSAYDFNSKVTSDITLTAIWKEVENANENNTNNNTTNNTTTNNDSNNNTNSENTSNTNQNSEDNQQNTQTTSCTPKKFNNTYSYVYDSAATCQKEGNNAFYEVTDNIDSSVFTYGCEEIVDDCGTTWYGVYFNRWAGTGDDVIKVYY